MGIKEKKTVEEIERYLKENHLNVDVLDDGPLIRIEIHWGDWKHDHLRCRYLMNEIDYAELDAFVTEEDGSDCFSAVYIFAYAGSPVFKDEGVDL